MQISRCASSGSLSLTTSLFSMQASTRCIPPRQCWKAEGSETLICGAYLISEQFWKDAGKPHEAEVGGAYFHFRRIDLVVVMLGLLL